MSQQDLGENTAQEEEEEEEDSRRHGYDKRDKNDRRCIMKSQI